MEELDLVRALCWALVKDGQAGIHNGVQDMDLRYVQEQYEWIEFGLKTLINIKDGKDVDYEDLCNNLKSAAYTHDLKSAIYQMLDYLESMEQKDNPDYICELLHNEHELIEEFVKKHESN